VSGPYEGNPGVKIGYPPTHIKRKFCLIEPTGNGTYEIYFRFELNSGDIEGVRASLERMNVTGKKIGMEAWIYEDKDMALN